MDSTLTVMQNIFSVWESFLCLLLFCSVPCLNLYLIFTIFTKPEEAAQQQLILKRVDSRHVFHCSVPCRTIVVDVRMSLKMHKLLGH